MMKNEKLKIIDCSVVEEDGEIIVKFYLGKNTLKDWYGDDWNDNGCIDEVYDRFVEDTKEISFSNKKGEYPIFPFDLYELEEHINKDMMKDKLIPLLVICYNVNKDNPPSYWSGLHYYKDKMVIFMGDRWEEIEKQIKDIKVKKK